MGAVEERFGELLDEYLKNTGMSQARFAERIGRDKNWVNQRLPMGWRGREYERKRLAIEANDIPELAKALNVPCWRFFEDTDCPEFREPAKLPEIPERVEPAIEMAAYRAAQLAVQMLVERLEEERRERPAPERKIEPSLAEIWARGRVRQWEQLPEAKQRRILEIMEEPEESKERDRE